jgi:hypothetical protein
MQVIKLSMDITNARVAVMLDLFAESNILLTKFNNSFSSITVYF